jgi:hypothetical protein
MKVKLQSFPKLSQQECQPSLNIVMSISPNTLESILGPNLESILAELDEIYPPTNPTPNDNIETIMYRSGQRSVVEWIRERVSSEE